MNNTQAGKWTGVAAALVLAVSFFLPWVSWEGNIITGSDIALGNFFRIADEKFGLANPYPQFDFVFNAFWLTPVLAVVVIVLVLMKKKTMWPALAAGALSLSLVIVYFLFSGKLAELGVSKSVLPWLYVQAFAATLLIIFFGSKNLLVNAGFAVLVTAGTWFGFGVVSKQAEDKMMGETHVSTGSLKEDYSLAAFDLIKEFLANDTAANKKYTEKILQVSGPVSESAVAADSTGTVSFADSTGSYAIFSIDKEQMEKVKSIKKGDVIIVKGVCSGGMFSDILGTTSITFKRSTIISK
ncbi:MAG: hypothetical protein IPM85_06160 [Chitinophagaceae bacterium]|nr:hypothetical protein [Chitinophagaceae bacterium]